MGDRWVALGVLLYNTMHALFLIINPLKTLNAIRFPNLFIPYRIKIKPVLIKGHKSIVKIKPGINVFQSGNWDMGAVRIDDMFRENPKYITAHEILNADGDIDIENLAETRFIEAMILKNGQSRGLRGAEDCLAYMKNRVKWYRSISDKGFLPQEELGGSKYVGEMQCAITRNGEIIKVNGGNHRFAAACILKPDFVYVHPAVLHEELFNSCFNRSSLVAIVNIRKLINNIEKKYS